ncbi:MAG: biotin/lipoyl-containing protein [Enterocloster sp.]
MRGNTYGYKSNYAQIRIVNGDRSPGLLAGGRRASVTKGSALAEITTDKITNTCEAPKDGILRKILLPEGEEAACGEAIAVLADTADEDISAECGGSQSEEGAFADSGEQAAAASPVPEKAAPADIKITPRAKKVAEEQGLEYSHIQGTGLLGAITISDLKKHGIPRKDPAGAASVSAAPASASVPASASGLASASVPASASAPASGPSTASARPRRLRQSLTHGPVKARMSLSR